MLKQNNIVWELLSDPYSADISLTPNSDSAQYKIKLMDAVLGKINATVSGNQAQVVGLIVPHPMDLLDGNHDSGEVDRSHYPDYQPRRLTNILEGLMRKHSMEYVNLYDGFKQHDPSSLYFQGGDDHWNDQGQRLAGDIVSNYLLSRELVGKRQ